MFTLKHVLNTTFLGYNQGNFYLKGIVVKTTLRKWTWQQTLQNSQIIVTHIERNTKNCAEDGKFVRKRILF